MASTEARKVLAQEHLYLGASLNENESVSHYAHEPADIAGEGVTLTDLSYMDTFLFAGEVAPSFVRTSFAGADLSAGHAAFEAVLTGDGALSSIALLVRTGEREYVALDGSPRAEVLDAWLSFLAATEADGYAPFSSLQSEDVTDTHVILLLRGKGAPVVLKDYLGQQALPEAGTVSAVKLDEIPCIVVSLPLIDPAYLILVPPGLSRVLWRSFLSFPEVVPVGTKNLARLLSRELAWVAWVSMTDVVKKPKAELVRLGLVRDGQDYVGARALTGEEGRA